MNHIRHIIDSVRRFFGQRPPVFQVVRRDPCRIRMEEWRSTPDLVKLAGAALSDPIMRQLVDVLRNEHLANDCCPGLIPIEQRAILQARAEGYSICLNNLESLAVFQKPQEQLEATFEPQSDEINA